MKRNIITTIGLSSCMILFAVSQSLGQLCNQTMNVGPHTTTYTSTMVRGYHFVAPTSFTICELYVPDNINTQMQHVEVVRFTAGPPPAYSSTTNNFVSLFYQGSWVPNTPIPCSITVNAGDLIGIYGARGNTATMYNTYSGTSYAATIAGNPVVLQRSGMQFTLNGSQMHDIWSEVNYSIGRIIMGYDPILLPVEFVSFTGFAEGEANILNWATASEQNCDFFDVERSFDGISFETIAREKGNGNSSTELNYTSRDNSPQRGVNYYRLRQVDYNGDFEYSNIIAVDNNLRSGFRIYPNPASKFIVVSFEEKPDGPSSVRLINALGQTMISQEVTEQSNVVSIEGLSEGMYVLETTLNGTVISEKFIKR